MVIQWQVNTQLVPIVGWFCVVTNVLTEKADRKAVTDEVTDSVRPKHGQTKAWRFVKGIGSCARCACGTYTTP